MWKIDVLYWRSWSLFVHKKKELFENWTQLWSWKSSLDVMTRVFWRLEFACPGRGWWHTVGPSPGCPSKHNPSRLWLVYPFNDAPGPFFQELRCLKTDHRPAHLKDRDPDHSRTDKVIETTVQLTSLTSKGRTLMASCLTGRQGRSKIRSASGEV